MKPVFIAGRLDLTQNTNTATSFKNYLPDSLQKELLKSKKFGLNDGKVFQRNKSRTTKTKSSKSKEKTRTQSKSKDKNKVKKNKLRSKSRKKESKIWIQKEDQETDNILNAIKDQLEIYQNKVSITDIDEKKTKILQVSAEVLALTREKNNLRLSYDTERLKWKDQKAECCRHITDANKLASQLESQIIETIDSCKELKNDADSIFLKIEEKNKNLEQIISENVNLESEMSRICSPSLHKYEKDYLSNANTRTLEMIDFENKKNKSTEIKIESSKTKINDIRKNIEKYKIESDEVIQFKLVQKRHNAF